MASLWPMQAGFLRHRVTIQNRLEVQDAHGQANPTYSTEATRWASIEPLRGREYLEAQQTKSNVTHKIALRYYSGLTTTHRIRQSSQTFNILSVVNAGNQNDRMTIAMCEELTSGA